MKLARLQELRDNGTLNELYQAGMISAKPYLMLEAGLKVKQLTAQRVKRGQAVVAAATILKCTRKTIYAYLRRLEP